MDAFEARLCHLDYLSKEPGRSSRGLINESRKQHRTLISLLSAVIQHVVDAAPNVQVLLVFLPLLTIWTQISRLVTYRGERLVGGFLGGGFGALKQLERSRMADQEPFLVGDHVSTLFCALGTAPLVCRGVFR